MHDAGDRAVVMEVSSHALVLHRADAIHLDTAVFTNLTQDHLDFHADMEEYFEAKRLLFEAGPAAAVVNADDPYGGGWPARSAASPSRRRAPRPTSAPPECRQTASGAAFTVQAPDSTVEVRTRLPGHFNVSNALAALAAAHSLGVPAEQAATALSEAAGVPGRFEPIDEGQPFTVLVDYAHTPEALENVLLAARPLTEGRVISVFGAGGDRDRDKRPRMGRIGAELSDLAIVTSDNPRSEQPEAIIAEIVAGIDDQDGIEIQADRRTAIGLALREASGGDTVLIAGKGHEQGQEFEQGRKIPFDDRDVAREELRALRGPPAAGRKRSKRAAVS